ncbi:MAG: cupin domain-containing protein [Candidatus Rokubacteria bacterium]|nr:cupin domain-containing protein [Candidatus Rokubacteria bacterium]
MADAVPTVQSDTPEARVTEWRLPPGSATGHHRHEYDYVVVPMTTGVLTIVAAAGRSEAPLTAGRSYFRKAGVEHDVRNETAREIVFVEVEIKSSPGRRA